MNFFLIKLVNGEHHGAYRFAATTQEIAVGRAQVSFRHEFGVDGILECPVRIQGSEKDANDTVQDSSEV